MPASPLAALGPRPGIAPGDRIAERVLRTEVRGEVGRLLDERGRTTATPDEETAIRELIEQRVARWQRSAATANTPPLADAKGMVQRLLDDVIGLGQLQPYLADDRNEEFMINGASRVFVVRDGHTHLLSDIVFDCDDEVLDFVKRLLAPLGRRLDTSSPMVDARLPDGSRLNAVIAPITDGGTYVTIRRFVLRAMSLDQLVLLGTASSGLARFLGATVQGRVNILISGQTGAGKTTLLNCLGTAIPPEDERVVTIEEIGELRLYRQLPNCVPLIARTSNLEGAGEVTIRDLVRNALRMRPTRLLVGECRGAEAFDVLLSMNTGHDGSMTTIHARTPREALDRLTLLAAMAEERVPSDVLTRLVARSIELVVQLSLDAQTGRRRITSVFEVTGVESGSSAPVITGNELWRYDRQRGQPVWTGIQPRLLEKLASRGIHYSLPQDADSSIH